MGLCIEGFSGMYLWFRFDKLLFTKDAKSEIAHKQILMLIEYYITNEMNGLFLYKILHFMLL